MNLKVLLTCLLAAHLMLSGVSVFGKVASNTIAADTIKVGQDCGNFEMKTSTGKVYLSNALKGKIVLMDFWATWCSPCRKLTAEIDSLLAKYRGNKSFLMMGVNYREFKPEAATAYWKEHGYSFPMVSDNDDFGKKIGAGNPTIIIIDGDGIIRGRWDSYSPQTANEIEATVKKLLADLK
ncbi:TlpA disulfide reductase family protein [Mucilaginibacter sp. SJ]|uniref:TlpA disulfide reductase family protein n=1 Tax=Mucilaginibacter sp. SJ TaxID=3029053 RepID=UPI0023AA0003|nr:TlpA disulfide reductase family protein [Mucilaginibacter sp. SJ]WEA00591.1 TlpA disulfide reductase family protein [Mucilaginibacter sp. SJ]